MADGPDQRLRDLVSTQPNQRLVELGRNWHDPACGNEGGIPRQVGCYLARGKLIAYLDDDNEWLPHHLQTLVAAIGDHDVAYSRYMKFVDGKPNGEFCPADGKGGRPARGDIDTNIILHRWELIRKANWRGGRVGEDWHLVKAWLNAGATFKWVDEVTVKYNAWHQFSGVKRGE